MLSEEKALNLAFNQRSRAGHEMPCRSSGSMIESKAPTSSIVAGRRLSRLSTEIMVPMPSRVNSSCRMAPSLLRPIRWARRLPLAGAHRGGQKELHVRSLGRLAGDGRGLRVYSVEITVPSADSTPGVSSRKMSLVAFSAIAVWVATSSTVRLKVSPMWNSRASTSARCRHPSGSR